MSNSPYKTSITTLARWEGERQGIPALYGLLKPGVSEPFTAPDLVEAANLPLGLVETFARTLERLGILQRTRGSMGRKDGKSFINPFCWQLLEPSEEDALMRLIADQESIEQKRLADYRTGVRKDPRKGRPRVEKVHRVPAESTTVAIVGPEPELPLAALAPLRKDEAGALIEAARQYLNREHTVDVKVKEMAEAMATIGVQFDMDAFRASIVLEHDDRLESIALVLPVITDLQRDVTRLQETVTTLREKAAQMPELRTTVERQRNHIDRLIAERTAKSA